MKNEVVIYTSAEAQITYKYMTLSNIKIKYALKMWAGIAQLVQRLATGWTVRGSNPGGVETFRTHPGRSWVPPSLLSNGYQVFPGVKAAEAWH
jgi:hypothetical protein